MYLRFAVGFVFVFTMGGLTGLTQACFVLLMVWPAMRGRKKAADKPWEGAARLEGTVPGPAPSHTFDMPPAVK
jgi:cytochrome c oxidase subunit 1